MESRTEHPKAYFIGGVNGVGKSTFLTEISARHPEFCVVKGSSVFMEWLGITPGDYDSLRALPDEHKRTEFDRMMNNLLTKPTEDGKVMLIDAHYFHYKRGEMVDTTGDWVSMLEALFVITGEVEEVFKRVSEDTKDRDLFPHGTTTDEQRGLLRGYLDVTIQKAQEISKEHGVPFFVINNIQGNMEETINSFLEAHTDIIKK